MAHRGIEHVQSWSVVQDVQTEVDEPDATAYNEEVISSGSEDDSELDEYTNKRTHRRVRTAKQHRSYRSNDHSLMESNSRLHTLIPPQNEDIWNKNDNENYVHNTDDGLNTTDKNLYIKLDYIIDRVGERAEVETEFNVYVCDADHKNCWAKVCLFGGKKFNYDPSNSSEWGFEVRDQYYLMTADSMNDCRHHTGWTWGNPHILPNCSITSDMTFLMGTDFYKFDDPGNGTGTPSSADVNKCKNDLSNCVERDSSGIPELYETE